MKAGPEERAELRLSGETPGSGDGRILRTRTYDILVDGRRVGTCELRPDTGWAARLAGQAAYTVFPHERGRHYALAALRLLETEASALGMGRLYITCRPENAASRRTLELAGAGLEAIEAVPPEHPLIRSGVREICVYVLNLPGNDPGSC